MWQGPENNEKKFKGQDFNALFKLCLFSSGFFFKFLSTTTTLSAVGIIHAWIAENPRPEYRIMFFRTREIGNSEEEKFLKG